MNARAHDPLDDARDALPLFPLPEIVLFPGAVLPLHVFEPRYRAMVADCLVAGGAMAIVQLVGGDDEHGRPKIARVAGGAVIAEYRPLPDGRSNILLVGLARVALEEQPPGPDDRPYRVAKATRLADDDVEVPELERASLFSAATMFAAEVRRHDPSFELSIPADIGASRLADLCAAQLVVDGRVRQAALAELDPRARVALVLAHLAAQHGAMRDAAGGVLH